MVNFIHLDYRDDGEEPHSETIIQPTPPPDETRAAALASEDYPWTLLELLAMLNGKTGLEDGWLVSSESAGLAIYCERDPRDGKLRYGMAYLYVHGRDTFTDTHGRFGMPRFEQVLDLLTHDIPLLKLRPASRAEDWRWRKWKRADRYAATAKQAEAEREAERERRRQAARTRRAQRKLQPPE